MSHYHRWLRICSDLGCIGSAILATWAIPLLHEQGLLALLPGALIIALGWLTITAAGCTFIWLRFAFRSAKNAGWLSPIDPFVATHREM